MTKPKPDHPLPANVSAEKAILGAVMLDNALFEATAVLEADDFSLESHRRIYQNIAEMIEQGEAVDLVTLTENMTASGDLQAIGDTPVAYLSDLSTDTIRYKPAVREWVKIVKAKSLLRQLIGACSAAVEKAYRGERGTDILAALKETLDEIESTAKRGMRG